MSSNRDIEIRVGTARHHAAWLVLLLCMAAFTGYQAASMYLSTRQLDRAYEARIEAADELAAARDTRRQADANLARAQALLQQAEKDFRKQVLEGRDAGQVSSL